MQFFGDLSCILILPFSTKEFLHLSKTENEEKQVERIKPDLSE